MTAYCPEKNRRYQLDRTADSQSRCCRVYCRVCLETKLRTYACCCVWALCVL